MRLGVNIDHIATLREARGTLYPDPVVAALLAEHGGCDSIVAHLREDRRHIKERDIFLLKKAITIPLNLEMSVNKEIVAFAKDVVPYQATLVPERRRELTTEGGIDLLKEHGRVGKVVKQLKDSGIAVSLFIDPLKKQIKAAENLGVEIVEFNTGKFSEALTKSSIKKETGKIKSAVSFARDIGLTVAAGHGLDYENVKEIVKIKGISELNIGHSVICRSVFIGLIQAVEEMLGILRKGSGSVKNRKLR